MSTKTSFKRIALVAVASLGMGVLTSVSAFAGASGIGTVTVVGQTATGFVGDTIKMPINVSTSAAGNATASADEVITVATTITSQPTDATAVAASVAVAHGGTATASTKVAIRLPGASNTIATTASTVLVPTASTNDLLLTPANAAAAGTYLSGALEFVPNTPGTYVFTLTPATTGTGDTMVAGTFTVTVLSLGGVTGDGGAVASPYNAVSGVTGEYNYVTLKATGMSRTTGALGTQFVVTGGTFVSASGQTLSDDKTKFTIAGVTHASNAGTSSTVLVSTKTAGTVTVKSYVETSSGVYSATATDTVTITVGAAALSQIYTSSTAYMNTSTTTPTSTSDATTAASAPLASSSASNTPLANILVTQKDGLATPADLLTANTKAIVYEISGAGALGTANNARLGSYIAVAAASANGNIVYIYPDGRSGVGTITVKVNGALVATKKVNFYGAVASLKATVKKNVAGNSAATTGALDVVAYDANNVIVPSVGITVTSGTSATVASFAETTSSAAEAAAGTAVVDVTGITGTYGSVVLTIKDTASGLISTTATVKVGAVEAATVTAAFDKASYAPGELVTLTISAKDANGADVADSTTATSLAITTNASVQGTLPTATAFVLGKQAITFYAPTSAVDLKASIVLTAGAAWSATLDGTTVTASSKVADSASVAALTLLINSLIKKINALSTLVAKIQKKLGVK